MRNRNKLRNSNQNKTPNKKVFNHKVEHRWKGGRMKIAHFVYVGPHKSGMYETTREICAAEVQAGYDACLIDTAWYSDKKEPPTTASRDRGIDIKPMSWAETADVHALHSIVPQELYGKAPIVAFLHGAPEYVFYSEFFGHAKGDRGFTTLLIYSQNPEVKKFVTLWDRHVEVWKTYLGKNVVYVPSCVDTDTYKLEGEKFKLVEPGKFNIGFCDSWRETYWKDPFRVISGIRLFYEKNDDVRLHFFSIPNEKKRDVVWDRTICAVKRTCPGLVGGIYERVVGMDSVYRALDVVVSPVREESRIVRESACCGTPIITMRGKTYSDYQVDFSEPQEICEALERCKKDLESNPDLPTQLNEQANNAFDSQATVSSLEGIYSDLVKSKQK